MANQGKSKGGKGLGTKARKASPGPDMAELFAGEPRLFKMAAFVGPRVAQQPDGFFTERGRFGRLFPELPALEVPDLTLEALGGKIHNDPPPSGDNQNVPAGYTYLGQFLDHDVTFDTTSLGGKQADPLGFKNSRTPALDLDSLYGRGPLEQPYLYDEPAVGALHRFLIGQTDAGRPKDLPRAPGTARALIGDPRNDENLIVAQFHLAMLQFHNLVVNGVPGVLPPAATFEEARRTVTWTYQYVVLNDFLARILDPAVLTDVRANGRVFYRTGPGFSDGPYLPVEFSVAAYRLGHSMVRDAYAPIGDILNASLADLFNFTGGGGSIVNFLSDSWVVQWKHFFPLDPTVTPNLSLDIDGRVTPALQGPPMPAPLATLNLKRGAKLGLPSGQAVARRMSLPPLTPAEVATSFDAAFLAANRLDTATPLWFYILQEALVHGAGKQLGQVGSRIVAEVFVGLLEEDPNSFLRQDPAWTPPIPRANPAAPWTMSDVLRFVNP